MRETRKIDKVKEGCEKVEKQNQEVKRGGKEG